jgi:hypothetical protein
MRTNCDCGASDGRRSSIDCRRGEGDACWRNACWGCVGGWHSGRSGYGRDRSAFRDWARQLETLPEKEASRLKGSTKTEGAPGACLFRADADIKVLFKAISKYSLNFDFVLLTSFYIIYIRLRILPIDLSQPGRDRRALRPIIVAHVPLTQRSRGPRTRRGSHRGPRRFRSCWHELVAESAGPSCFSRHCSSSACALWRLLPR